MKFTYKLTNAEQSKNQSISPKNDNYIEPFEDTSQIVKSQMLTLPCPMKRLANVGQHVQVP